MPPSPRLASKKLHEANHRLPIFRLPQELHDHWIGHVAQPPGGPGGPGPRQDLLNLRLASRELGEVSVRTFLDTQFENLELRLETRTTNDGDIDFLLTRMHVYRDYNPGQNIKSIRFIQNETLTVPSGGFPLYIAVDPTRIPLTAADSALLGPRLNTLFRKTNNLLNVETLAPSMRSSDLDLQQPLRQLLVASRYPTMALDRVALTCLDYRFAYNILRTFLSRWRQSLSSVDIHRVFSTSGAVGATPVVDWPRNFIYMRDNMPKLNRVSLFRLRPVDLSQNIQLVPTEPTTRVIEFMNMTENIPVGVEEGFQLRIGGRSGMQGRYGVKCGLNTLLQLHNIPNFPYNPALDGDVLGAAGILAPVP